MWSKAPVAVWFARSRLIKRLITGMLLHPLTLWLDFEDLLMAVCLSGSVSGNILLAAVVKTTTD